MSDQAKRAYRACVILGVGFVLIVLSATCTRTGTYENANRITQSMTAGTLVLQDALTESPQKENDVLNGDDDELIEHLFAVTGGDVDRQSTVPDAFMRECFDPDAVGASQLAYRNGVVGASCDSGIEETFDACTQEMTLHGWNVASKSISETACLCALSKDSGLYSWAYLLCQSIGESTSVVVLVKEA